MLHVPVYMVAPMCGTPQKQNKPGLVTNVPLLMSAGPAMGRAQTMLSPSYSFTELQSAKELQPPIGLQISLCGPKFGAESLESGATCKFDLQAQVVSLSGGTPRVISEARSPDVASVHLGFDSGDFAVFPANQRKSKWWRVQEESPSNSAMLQESSAPQQVECSTCPMNDSPENDDARSDHSNSARETRNPTTQGKATHGVKPNDTDTQASSDVPNVPKVSSIVTCADVPAKNALSMVTPIEIPSRCVEHPRSPRGQDLFCFCL